MLCGNSDVDFVRQKLQERKWLENKIDCFECGKEGKQRTFCLDDNGPFSQSDGYICKKCWDENNTLREIMGLKVCTEPVFATLHVTPPKKEVCFIYDKSRNTIIGTVTNYNPDFHTGKVCLYEKNEEFAEMTALLSHWEVK